MSPEAQWIDIVSKDSAVYKGWLKITERSRNKVPICISDNGKQVIVLDINDSNETRTIQLGRQLAQKEKPKKTIQVAFPWINYISTRWGNFLIFKLSFRNDGGLTVSIFKFILISKTIPLWGHRHSKQPKTIQLSSRTGITFGTSNIAF